MSRRGWVLFVVMSVVWGLPYLMIKVAVGGVSVPVLVFVRVAIGALVLLPVALRGGGLRTVRRHWKPVVTFTLFEMVGPWWFLSDAERRLPSSLAGLIIATVPVLGIVFARLSGGTDRLGWKRWAGLVVGLAGVATLVGPNLAGGTAWPTVEVLLTAVGYGIAPLIAARYLGAVPTVALTSASLALAALIYAVPAGLTWPDALPSGRVLAALAGLALICTALAFVVFFELIREVGSGRAMVITYINPAVAVAAGVAVLGEPLTVPIVVAFVLILAGSALATAKDATPTPLPDRRRLTRLRQTPATDPGRSKRRRLTPAASNAGGCVSAGGRH